MAALGTPGRGLGDRSPIGIGGLAMKTSKTRSTTPFGGVSAVPQGPALKRFARSPDDLAPAAKAAAAHPRFKYHGGPIVTSPVVHASFWGGAWHSGPAHGQRAARLGQFLQDL